MVKFGALTAVTLPWASSISPWSSPSLSPPLTVDVVTLNVGATVAEVTGLPFSVTEDARFRSKFTTTELDLVMVSAGLNVTVIVDEESVAGTLAGAPPLITTTSGLATESVAPEYVPGGILSTASGSKIPASCTNSTSVGLVSRFGVLAVPPLPVRVAELIVSSNLRIWSFVASPVLNVALLAVTGTEWLLLPQLLISSVTAAVINTNNKIFFKLPPVNFFTSF